jgi:hypothetical protein
MTENNIINNWSSKKESVLNNWCFESELYIWLHNYNAEYYEKLDKFLSIPAIIISAITSTALFSSLGLDDNTIVIIVFGVLLIIGVFLQSSRDYLKITELIHKNRNSSKLYQIISHDIEEQLNEERDEREDGTKFLQKIKTKINNIIMNSPPITHKSWKKLQSSINRGDIIRFNRSQFFKNYFKKENTDTIVNIDTNQENLNDENNNNENHNDNRIHNDINDNDDEKKNNLINTNELDLSIENLQNKLRFID